MDPTPFFKVFNLIINTALNVKTILFHNVQPIKHDTLIADVGLNSSVSVHVSNLYLSHLFSMFSQSQIDYSIMNITIYCT